MLCFCLIVQLWMETHINMTPKMFLLLSLTGTTAPNSCAGCVSVSLRIQPSHSIINAVVFLFSCFGATWSSLGDAFLMMQERRDGPCGLWGGSVSTQWTLDCVRLPPTKSGPWQMVSSAFFLCSKKLTMFSVFANLVLTENDSDGCTFAMSCL